MKKIAANDPETGSTDIVADNLERLKISFPDAFTEGKIDFDVLRQLLGDAVDEREDKYGLNWHGKRRARQLALTPSTGTLRPCPEDSVDWDRTRNLMIEGDNLEVLKLLQKSYASRVKLIYIDPPYNTGKDFIYPDNYHDNIRHYLALTGQIDSENRTLSSNTDASGRFHTDWLNMIYPRLKLARDLLRDDGAIFVSIADHEVHNLRYAMDDVFGGENFVATVVWQKIFSPKNSARHFSEDHDYVVVYARSGVTWMPHLLPRTKRMEDRYGNPDNDPRGPWTSGDVSARNYYGLGTYSVTCPSGRVISGPPSGTYWRVSKERFEELDKDGRIWWGKDGNNVPRLKRFRSEVQDGRVPQTLWRHDEVGHTQEAKKELLALMDEAANHVVFDTPKPTRLVRRILQIATSQSEVDITLDFFAGAGSTMDAMFRQNAEDRGNRRCILVQLPEPITKSNDRSPENIAELAKERLRRAANKIKNENPMFTGDVGFRVFKLDTSNIRAWNPDPSDLDGALLAGLDHIEPGRTEQDILYELLLKLGLDLCVPIETRTIASKSVHAVGAGTLIACLDEAITGNEVEPLALGVVDWYNELASADETTVVFRDNAFADDVAKTNLAAILEQHGLTNVRSL